MRSAIRRMGNSQGLIVPRPLLLELGLSLGDAVDLKIKKGRLVVSPATRPPRAGWADDSRRIAEPGGGLEW